MLTIHVMNRMIQDKDAIIADYKVIIDQLTDTTTLDEEERRLKAEAEIVLEMINRAVAENAKKALDQAEFGRRYAELVTKYNEIKKKASSIKDQLQVQVVRHDKLY